MDTVFTSYAFVTDKVSCAQYNLLFKGPTHTVRMPDGSVLLWFDLCECKKRRPNEQRRRTLALHFVLLDLQSHPGGPFTVDSHLRTCTISKQLDED